MAYCAAIAGLPSQIAYGSWQKILHTKAAMALPFKNNDRNVNPSLGFFRRWCIGTRKPSLSKMQMGFQTQALLKLNLVGVNAI